MRSIRWLSGRVGAVVTLESQSTRTHRVTPVAVVDETRVLEKTKKNLFISTPHTQVCQ